MAFTAWLNLLPVRAYKAAYTDRLRGSYFQHFAWTVACLPVPRPLLRLWRDGERDEQVRRLIAISEQLHENPDRPNASELEAELAEIVAALYGLTDEDLNALCRYWSFVRP